MDIGSEQNNALATYITNIEAAGATENVLKWVVEGQSEAIILENLRTLFPAYAFTIDDLRTFNRKNIEVIKRDILADTDVKLRKIPTTFIFRDKLITLQREMEEALKAAADERNYHAMANLHNSILKNIQLYTVVQEAASDKINKTGKHAPQTNIQVNVGTVSNFDEIKLRDKILKKDFVIDVEAHEVKEKKDGILQDNGPDIS